MLLRHRLSTWFGTERFPVPLGRLWFPRRSHCQFIGEVVRVWLRLSLSSKPFNSIASHTSQRILLIHRACIWLASGVGRRPKGSTHPSPVVHLHNDAWHKSSETLRLARGWLIAVIRNTPYSCCQLISFPARNATCHSWRLLSRPPCKQVESICTISGDGQPSPTLSIY